MRGRLRQSVRFHETMTKDIQGLLRLALKATVDNVNISPRIGTHCSRGPFLQFDELLFRERFVREKKKVPYLNFSSLISC